MGAKEAFLGLACCSILLFEACQGAISNGEDESGQFQIGSIEQASTNPGTVTITPNDTPKLITFTSWHYVPGVLAVVHPVDTMFFGSLRSLPWPVWKFKNVVQPVGGTGVQGELFFDRTTPQANQWGPVYDGLLWPGRALLKLYVTYGNEGTEVVEVKLTP